MIKAIEEAFANKGEFSPSYTTISDDELEYEYRKHVISNTLSSVCQYELLLKNEIVALIGDRVLDFTERAPFLIKNNRFEDWKAIRTQDLNRPNSRALRRMLGLSTSNPQDVLPIIYYQSISDAYWLRKVGDSVCWGDIQFTDDRFYIITLTGKGLLDNLDIYKNKASPEHSNSGSFEKGWKYVPTQRTKWQLWKAGSSEAVWSEVFYSKLANKIFPGIAVNYWECDGFSVCDSFIDREACECLEPFYSYHSSHDDSEKALSVLPETLHEDYRKMLFLDAIMYNWDRHEFNFGTVCDTNSDIKLHPLYDFNLCLFNGATPGVTRFEDTTIKMYNRIKNKPYVVKKEWITQAYDEVGFFIDATVDQTLDFILKSVELVGGIIK